MKQSQLIPVSLIMIQLSGILYVLYDYKFANSHIPVAFIGLNLLAIFSVLVLVASWFLYFKAKQKIELWRIVVALSLLILATLMITFMVMAFNKYQ